jgi:GT2 family glycosyltransferase
MVFVSPHAQDDSVTNRIVAESVVVVIVNWNAGSLLRRCIEAVKAQSLRPGRIVVIDNGSSDGSLEAIGDDEEWLDIVRLGRNAGFAEANNIALERFGDAYRWFALLNPDAFPEPGWLQALVTASRKRQDAAVFASRLMRAESQEEVDGAGDCYHVSGLVWRIGHGQRRKADEGNELKEVFSACAAAALYKSDVLRDVGAFDPAYFCYLEDVDLGFRLRLAGYKCVYVPDAVVCHIGSATTGGKNSDFAVYHGHRNLVWTYFKNMPGVLLWLYLPQHLLLNLASVVWYTFRGQRRVILRAKWDALRRLPEVWRQRRVIQAQRRVSAWVIRRLMAGGLFTLVWRRYSC